MKSINNELNFIEVRTLKNYTTNCEKIFVNHIPYNMLESQIENSYNLMIRQKLTISKCEKIGIDISLKKLHKFLSKPLKQAEHHLEIRKIQIKTMNCPSLHWNGCSQREAKARVDVVMEKLELGMQIEATTSENCCGGFF